MELPPPPLTFVAWDVFQVIRMLFHLYGLESVDDPARYCVYEQNPSRDYERRLSRDDRPMQVRPFPRNTKIL